MSVPYPTSDISDRPETSRRHLLPQERRSAASSRSSANLGGHLVESVAHN